MSVHPFPSRRDPRAGVIHVMGDRIDGFEVAHESASGNSWGGFECFAKGEDAITRAYAMNRDQYAGACEVYVCDAAVQDQSRDVGLVSLPGDF